MAIERLGVHALLQGWITSTQTQPPGPHSPADVIRCTHKWIWRWPHHSWATIAGRQRVYDIHATLTSARRRGGKASNVVNILIGNGLKLTVWIMKCSHGICVRKCSQHLLLDVEAYRGQQVYLGFSAQCKHDIRVET